MLESLAVKSDFTSGRVRYQEKGLLGESSRNSYPAIQSADCPVSKTDPHVLKTPCLQK